jgi:hypothetical protein
MNITTYEYPYKHIIADGVIPSSLAHELYSNCNAIEENTIDFTRDGQYNDSIEMFRNSKNINPLEDENKAYVYNQIERVSRLFTGLYNSKTHGWSISANEVNRSHGNLLTPHTDDPVVMRSRGMNPPILRCLLYIADENMSYSHYGTKMYTDSNRSSYVKEVEFISSRLIMFECSDKSWHGTDFIKGLPNRRFFINGLYQYIVDTPGKIRKI